MDPERYPRKYDYKDARHVNLNKEVARMPLQVERDLEYWEVPCTEFNRFLWRNSLMLYFREWNRVPILSCHSFPVMEANVNPPERKSWFVSLARRYCHSFLKHFLLPLGEKLGHTFIEKHLKVYFGPQMRWNNPDIQGHRDRKTIS